jgi:thiamine-monophosphate kinase
LIQRIRKMSAERTSGVRAAGLIQLGIGDDTAILRFPPTHEVLVTSDFSLEGVHFRRDWHPPGAVGYRCLARGLSDIAAMGGAPVAAFLSLSLPAKLPQRWVDGFLRGLLALAHQYGVTLAGGDTAQSPGASAAKILADIVVLGSAPRGQAIRRSGAKPGDLIYVTGTLGASALELETMYAQPKKKLDPKKPPAHFFSSRHFYPQPRLAVGRFLRQRGLATAMIDVSDGLSTDLDHLCRESGVGAQIFAGLLPRAEGDTLEHALHGGEDYELLFTASAYRKIGRSIAGVPVTHIGEIRRSSTRVILLGELPSDGRRSRKLLPRGWEHFATARRRP